ncbi:hypothetical protein GCM10022288_26900 [Gryllotalpicola kribbensis]|uniref:Schlafen AlbA-2 domain-containing protein n=1 Tax=Gryllotalpicola kribbensis TaxID=993084 RepID=A0ABP8AY51_9MICO
MWIPRDEHDIQLAIDEGNLAESHYLDAKASSGDTPGARAETARDLASFAIDGGVLLIGVAEDKQSRTFSTSPVPLKDLIEKIEQIAANRIDPPLDVRAREIPAESDPDHGYAAVEIPPSPQAPHMVDGVYYGRGERTRRRLSDAEVVRHHQARKREEDRLLALLHEEIERDPVPAASRQNGHLYLVAEPLSASRNVAQSLVRAPQQRLNNILHQSNYLPYPTVRDFAPGAPSMRGAMIRSRGAAFTSTQNGTRSITDAWEERGLSDVEFHEDGSIHAVVGRATDQWDRMSVSSQIEPQMVIFDGLCIAFAHRIIYWVTKLSEEVGYRGSWGLALGVNGLVGKSSYLFQQELWQQSGPVYDRDEYEEVTVASLDDLVNEPQAVAYRLVGGLLRGLGTDNRWAPEFTKTEEPAQ